MTINSDNDNEILLSLKPSPEKKNNNPENVVNYKYHDIDQIQTLKFPDKHKSLTLFHINACSLNKTLMILTIYSSAQIKNSTYFLSVKLELQKKLSYY